MGDFEDLRVLVIDDHEIQRTVVVRRLQTLGVTDIQEAPDGESGLRVLQERNVDLVFCDLVMPVMDGLEFVRRVAEQSRDVAIVFLSAADPVVIECADLMTREREIRFLGALEKPAHVDQIKRILRDARRERTTPSPLVLQPIEAIREGLDEGRFVPFFQPVVDAKSGITIGAEALARWVHPELGILRPSHFLQPMEEAGVIDELTWAVLDGSMALLSRLKGKRVKVSVNLSGGFLSTRFVSRTVSERVTDAGLLPTQIGFEVTESTALTTNVDCLENLARLRMNGHDLAIDDFGTAYASLRQLVRVPFQVMKVDRSFVRDAVTHSRAQSVLRSTVFMARDLNMSSVIEGVESDQELDLLSELPCDAYQGYYFARPMSADAFVEWMLQEG